MSRGEKYHARNKRLYFWVNIKILFNSDTSHIFSCWYMAKHLIMTGNPLES